MIVCVTGKIGTGKSTVAKFFAEKGFAYINLDELGKLAFDALRERVLEAFGTVDRRAIAELVFSSREKLKLLESILHPKMLEMLNIKLAEFTKQNCNVVVEAAIKRRLGIDRCDEVITVVSSLENVKKRLGHRYSAEMIEKIVVMQDDVAPEGYVLENNGTIEEFRERIEELYGIILSKYGASRSP